jgi:hypothetical protein
MTKLSSLLMILFIIVASSLANAASPFSSNTLRGLNYIKYQLYDTWDPTNTTASWQGWYQSTNKDGNSALRYTIAHLGYTAALAAKVAASQPETEQSRIKAMAVLSLRGAIERMLDNRVWNYISMFGYGLDPVKVKNVMYSGHLAQLISLYENLSGDLETYSVRGFVFSWNNGTQIHYNTSALMYAIWNQMGLFKSGGVPCEPDSIFVICNSFSNNAFVLHDRTHNTTFHTAQNKSFNWYQNVVNNAIIGGKSIFDAVTKQYFALDFLLFPGIWEPLGSEGSDAWALSFQGAWWPEQTLSLLAAGYQWLRDSPQWLVNASTQEAEIIQEKKNPIAKMIFPFPDDVTTSFFPMIWQQYGSSNTSDVKGKTLASFSLNYFTKNFVQTVADCKICIRYDSSENYRDWVTANVVAGQVLIESGVDGMTLRNMFQEGF